MNNKAELKKQLVVFSLILVLVIIIAIILNVNKPQGNTNNHIVNNQTNNVLQDKKTEEQKILDNLKGLLEEPTKEEDYIQDETQGTIENKVITQGGETVIVRE